MNNDSKITEKITIRGIVQGVGFRPFVVKLADRMGIDGSIKNMGGFVELTISGVARMTDSFIETIHREKPKASEIVQITREKIPFLKMKGFSIEESEVKDDEIGMIPADMAICDDCLKEFYDSADPRYKHPFISCMVCGPRYTIIDSLPYDRDNTTMRDFPMCDFCSDQYSHKSARRYHSQTVSCHDCGPMPEYHKRNGRIIKVEPHHDDEGRGKAAAAAIRDINDGKVIALKGTGGYYFVCSPFDAEAVEALREIKIREEKPFAVMFKDMDSIRNYCTVGDEEEKLLTSSKRPIVLLEKKEDNADNKKGILSRREDSHNRWDSPGTREFVNGVCRSSRYIGAFLPSFGLQYQLIDETGPLIMTSANLSNLPIIYKDEEMLNLMKIQPELSGVLLNRRVIRMSLDDTVARVIDGNPQLTRRSKGYAPVPIYIDLSATDSKDGAGSMSIGDKADRHAVAESLFQLDKSHQIFAAGGQLKSAFTLSKGNFSYVSQYFGDLDTVESQSIYENNFRRMKKFFGIEPDIVVCDMHPLYYTTEMAEAYVENENKLRLDSGKFYGKKKKIQLLKVQHHHAHTASVMAEHGLSGPVIGVSFDGTGYGTDGNIWGGEFLICTRDGFERHSHLKYVEMIGGDSSMKEGWKSAVSHRWSYMDIDGGNRSQAEASIEGQLHTGKNSIKSTDKCQLTLDISDIIDYSIREETLAEFMEIPTVEAAVKNRINTVKTSSMGRLFDAVSSLLGIHHINRYEGECAIMLENAAYNAVKNPGRNKAWDLALKFHYGVAEMIERECRKIRNDRGINDVALSGGVFQNRILMERTLNLLREENFSVYYNSAVPPNDGGIALGQNFIGMYHMIDNVHK